MLDYVLIGKNIRTYRLARNLTQEILAEKVDVTPDYIRKIENGISRPSLSLLEKLAETFEIDIFFLMTDHINLEILMNNINKELLYKIGNFEPETKRALLKLAKNIDAIDEALRK